VISLYTAPVDDNPFAEATIRKANPALGDFLNRESGIACRRARPSIAIWF
jgi:hypothetical protein